MRTLRGRGPKGQVNAFCEGCLPLFINLRQKLLDKNLEWKN